MFKRVILEHQSRDPDHLRLLGMIDSDPVLVELDTGACMKLGGWISGRNTGSLVDQHYETLARAAERLYDQGAYEDTSEAFGMPHILVTALDID
ncbi:hypothetical protein ASE00_07620 [Sphingomonas sp. Root710]|uniref:hypothetical protein n=1 Tax=Sphingomonas sp. Root710 TaxID=1736594 RepID=UPI0006FFAC99|nr:hypothetical protein [Sphingomonas sp. Root710]KRB86552.1 hypothetical protein ASE00_07620 [Sphingomonas sp. Root710]